MTEAFVAIIASMIAILGVLGTAVGVAAAFTAMRDWQREKASLNCEPGRDHRWE
jgi:hypothetical protein